MTENYISQNSDERKRTPMASGLLDYFPAALAAVAQHSFLSNEKHNPGQDLHWSRQNSTDHADCIVRHLIERGGMEAVYIQGERNMVRHSAALAWRALALLQEELEKEGFTPGRASRFPPEPVNEFGMTDKQVRAEAMAYDVRVVADKEEDAKTAKVFEGLLNYWRHEPVPSYELTPAGLAALAKPVKKKRAVPKPVRKRK